MKKPALRWLTAIPKSHFLLTALLFGLLPILSVQNAFAANLHVMVNESVMISELNRTDLRQIFTGHRQYWQDGRKISVFVLQDDDVLHKEFCREILHMFPYQLSRLWDQITFSGQGVTPVRVSSYQALIEALESTEGAIGYVEKNDIVKLRRVEVSE